MDDLVLKGKAVKLGDNISTDDIIPGRFAHLRSNLPELSKHTFEDTAPDFASRVNQGDFLVAGGNFGLGSSREHAPLVIKISGIGAILVKSAARIFFRNAINQGLPVLLCDTDQINDGDQLEVDLTQGVITNLTSKARLTSTKMPPLMFAIFREGGLIPYIKKHRDFKLLEEQKLEEQKTELLEEQKTEQEFKVEDRVAVTATRPGAFYSGATGTITVVEDSDFPYQVSFDKSFEPAWFKNNELEKITLKEGDRVKVISKTFPSLQGRTGTIDRIDTGEFGYHVVFDNKRITPLSFSEDDLVKYG